jgi:hypothetical protein
MEGAASVAVQESASLRFTSSSCGVLCVAASARNANAVIDGALNFSRKYDNAPRPHAILFHGGFAVHGTTTSRSSVASPRMVAAGLHPANAVTLFALVACNGARNTTIEISTSGLLRQTGPLLTAR